MWPLACENSRKKERKKQHRSIALGVWDHVKQHRWRCWIEETREDPVGDYIAKININTLLQGGHGDQQQLDIFMRFKVLQWTPESVRWRKKEHEENWKRAVTYEGAATVSKKVKPWRKCGAHTIDFLRTFPSRKTASTWQGTEQVRGTWRKWCYLNRK